MLKRVLISMGAIIFLLCTGCANTTGYYPDSPLVHNWGRSVESMRLNQTVTPTSTATAPPSKPIVGLDQAAGKAVIDKYRKSFETETKREQVQMVGGG